MKQNNIIYWIATGLLCAMMLMSGVMYFTSPDMAKNFHDLGFPDWFRQELGVAKILGVAALLLPAVPANVKEWAYAGFGVVFISAIIAHATTMGISTIGMPVVALVLLVVSYIYSHKLRTA